MSKKLLMAAAAAVALLLPACGSDEPEPTPSPTDEPTATATDPAESPAPDDDATTPDEPPTDAPDLASWSTDDVSAAYTGGAGPIPTLVDLRVGAHPDQGFDRLVAEFEGLPGYEIGYRDTIVYDGTGDPVDLSGKAFIQLVFNPARAHDDDGYPTLTPTPNQPVDAGHPALRSYVMNGDFEGYVSVAIGVGEKSGFRVDHFRKDNGNDVVYIDIARP
jgi:hypothetical protein